MKNLLTILAFLMFAACYAQNGLPPATDHYKSLQTWSDSPNAARKWMDTVKYPSAEYGSSIVYLIVKPHYLNDNQVIALSESVKFPANSSDQVRKELDYLLDLQSKRTQEQIKRVEYIGNVGYWPSVDVVPTHTSYRQNLNDLFFEGREVFGAKVTAQSYPLIAEVLKGVMRDMRIMEFTVKYKLLRPRPYHLEPKLQPLTRINSPSFASGHTLWAFVQAYTWSLIVPEKKNQFLALAEEIRRSREIMGIHYPSDNEAARKIAFQMVELYKLNDTFKTDLKRAQQEWKSFQGSLSPR